MVEQDAAADSERAHAEAEMEAEEAAIMHMLPAEADKAAETAEATDAAASAERVRTEAEEMAQRGADVSYATTLREALEADGVLDELEHVTIDAVDAALSLYTRYDSRRDGRMRLDDFVTAMKAYGRACGSPGAYRAELLKRAFHAAVASGDGTRRTPRGG